jgi:hypothetical protein
MASTYPVIAEIWTLFEGVLQANAKRLVEDIAKQNKADPKVLWDHIRPRIKIGLLDLDLPEDQPICCAHMSVSEGAVKMRCRAPCVLGFTACPKHVNTPLPSESEEPKVDRVLDMDGLTYFVNEHTIAMDKYGQPKGYVEDGVLTLFEKRG